MQLFGIATNASCASDDAHAGRDGQLVHGFAQLLTLFALDATRNTTATWVVRHQDQITTCEGDKSSQCCALVAAFLFFNLNDQLLTFAQCVLNTRCPNVDTFFEIAASDFFEG